jgi:hypothetical protein
MTLTDQIAIVKAMEIPIKKDASMNYQIRIEGHLGPQWTDWFEGMIITLEENGEMLISGPVADQAALYGLLKKVRNLGLPLISVNRHSPTQTLEVRK